MHTRQGNPNQTSNQRFVQPDSHWQDLITTLIPAPHRVLVLQTLILALTFCSVLTISALASPEPPMNQRVLSLEIQNLSFDEALNAVSGKLTVNIHFVGDKPPGTRNISLKDVTLGRAMGRIMRAYGVDNHAVAYQADTNTLVVANLKSASIRDLRTRAALGPESHADQPLTPEQLARLRESSLQLMAELEEAAKPLTQEQLDRLREQSLAYEESLEQASQPLTEEQLDRLREQSRQYEQELEQASQPLTPEQLERLQEQSRRFEEDEKQASSPLTEEQLRMLRENQAF